MDNKNKTSYIEKDDAFNILDRTIDFIRNCDNKASIFLGVFGALLTVAFTTGSLDNLLVMIESAIEQKTLGSVLYLLVMGGFLIAMAFGLVRIVKVLGVTIDSSVHQGLDTDSRMFFEHISKNDYLSYKEKLLTTTEEEFLNDIISQIYINSRICHDKYKSYKCGMKWTLVGFCGFVLLGVLGVVIF